MSATVLYMSISRSTGSSRDPTSESTTASATAGDACTSGCQMPAKSAWGASTVRGQPKPGARRQAETHFRTSAERAKLDE